jgi:hypothetical protein
MSAGASLFALAVLVSHALSLSDAFCAQAKQGIDSLQSNYYSKFTVRRAPLYRRCRRCERLIKAVAQGMWGCAFGAGLAAPNDNIGWWNCANSLEAIVDYMRVRGRARVAVRSVRDGRAGTAAQVCNDTSYVGVVEYTYNHTALPFPAECALETSMDDIGAGRGAAANGADSTAAPAPAAPAHALQAGGPSRGARPRRSWATPPTTIAQSASSSATASSGTT